MQIPEPAEGSGLRGSHGRASQSPFAQFVRKYAYTGAVIAAVAVALLFPQYFVQINGFRLQKLIVPLLQIIMVGVGCTMGWRDLVGVLRMPKAVLVGLLCVYTIMPLAAFAIARIFPFPPEIAAGLVLVGCCPSGLASNVIALLAKANVPLSVTVTTVSTLLAPLATPLLMRLLGGGFVQVEVGAMIVDMVKLVVFPICVGVFFNSIFVSKAKLVMKVMPTLSMAGIAAIIVIITAAGRHSLLHVGASLLAAVFLHMIFGFAAGYLVALFCRLPEEDCRTISIEVGMQNGGLATGIAMQMGLVATMGLAAAIKGPVMNVAFSLLGTWWGKRPPQTNKTPFPTPETAG
jgi:bile acid:Na+ symporter, BASS family